MATLCGGNDLGQLIQIVSIMANGGGRSKPKQIEMCFFHSFWHSVQQNKGTRCPGRRQQLRQKRSLTLNVRTLDQCCASVCPTSSVTGLTLSNAAISVTYKRDPSTLTGRLTASHKLYSAGSYRL